MDRQIIYPAAIPLETDLLNTNKYAMIGLAKLSAAIMGSNTYFHGLQCTASSPASMIINIAPGEVYSLQNVDGTAYSSLNADTNNSIIKQGIILSSTPFTLTAPTTSGQSINYLIQVTYTDTDSGSTVLPYYNAANPSVAYSGPNNTGAAQNTVRSGVCTISLKAGISATTGTQTTPSPDTGYTAAWVITVPQGATTITASNITQAVSAPFIPVSGLVDGIQKKSLTHAADSGSVNSYVANFSPAITTLTDGMELTFKAANTNTGACTFSINGLTASSIVRIGGSALTGGEIVSGGSVTVKWNATLSSWFLINTTGNGAALLNIAATGRLLNVQTFTASGTYTPTAGTKSIIVKAIGAGGGTDAAPATTTGQVSIVSGAGAGAYAEARFTSGFSGLAVTVGVGGRAGVAGTPTGAIGGTTTFGSLLTAPGGSRGASAGPANPPFAPQGNLSSTAPTGANILGAPGSSSVPAYASSTTSFLGSPGASSFFGGGGWVPAFNNTGIPGQAYGSGAGGPSQGPSGALVAGGQGAGGVVIIWEYA